MAKEVKHARIACTIREMKKYNHRKRMKACSNKIKHQGDVGTPTAYLETVNFIKIKCKIYNSRHN